MGACVHDHPLLLGVEKTPNFRNNFEVVFSDLVKIGLLEVEFLTRLLGHHIQIEAKESLQFWNVFCLEVMQ